VSGWGSGSWGGSFWGSGTDAPRLVSALAIRENCVRLSFDLPIIYDRTRRPRDASNPKLFSITPILGTASLSGEKARQVIAGRVDAAEGNAAFDLWLDRPLTGWPARYLASAHGVYGVNGVAIDASAASAAFDGTRAAVLQREPTTDATFIGSDLALPQTEAAAALARATGALLGSFAVDVTGDYATDAGIPSLMKRILRRLFAKPGAFRSLPDTYGEDLGGLVKHLGTASKRAEAIAKAERGARLEPEVSIAKATFDSLGGGLWLLNLKVRTSAGIEATMPIPLQSA